MSESIEETVQIGKLVGQLDAMIEQQLREGFLTTDAEQQLRRDRATMMSHFRAILGRM